MSLLAASRETEIGKLNMTTTVEKNIVRFDITVIELLSVYYFEHK